MVFATVVVKMFMNTTLHYFAYRVKKRNRSVVRGQRFIIYFEDRRKITVFPKRREITLA